SLLEEADNLVQFQVARPFVGVVTAEPNLWRKDGLGLGLLNVFWNIDKDGPGPAGLGKVNRFLYNPWDLVHIRDEVAVLHDRQSHPVYICFLKSSLADHRLWDLPRHSNEGNRIHVDIGDSSDQVAAAGATGGKAH